MNAKVLPEIELNNDIESNIERLKFDDLHCNLKKVECPICFEEFSYNIKDFEYTIQCDTGKHYLCVDCNTNWIKTCNESRKDHTCVICKNLIKRYLQLDELNIIHNIRVVPIEPQIPITNHRINDSLPFILKLLIFDFIFIVITLIIMGNMTISENIKNGIYFMYGFLMLCTLLVCCITR